MPDIDIPSSLNLPASMWEKTSDKNKLEALYLLLDGMDWAQTRTIAKNPQQYHETNPILGKHPSVGFVNNYFGAMALGHALLADKLPPDLAKLFQYGTIGFEAAEVGRNKFKFGIGMSF
jgi:hypothetical protein